MVYPCPLNARRYASVSWAEPASLSATVSQRKNGRPRRSTNFSGPPSCFLVETVRATSTGLYHPRSTVHEGNRAGSPARRHIASLVPTRICGPRVRWDRRTACTIPLDHALTRGLTRGRHPAKAKWPRHWWLPRAAGGLDRACVRLPAALPHGHGPGSQPLRANPGH